MTWQQPMPQADGTMVLTHMSHPCVSGCSGWWKAPSAQQADVIDVGASSATIGNVALANQDHRCDWFLPRPGGSVDALEQTGHVPD